MKMESINTGTDAAIKNELGSNQPEAEKAKSSDRPVDSREARVKQLLSREGKFSGSKLYSMAEAGYSNEEVQDALKGFLERIRNIVGRNPEDDAALTSNEAIMGMLQDAKLGEYNRIFLTLQNNSAIKLARAIEEARSNQEMAAQRAGIQAGTEELPAEPKKKVDPTRNVTEGIGYLQDLKHQSQEQFEGSGPAEPEVVSMAANAGEAAAVLMELPKEVARQPVSIRTEAGGLFKMTDLQPGKKKPGIEAGEKEGLPLVT